MEALIILTFIIGYLAITLEHPLKLDKTVPALLMATVMWSILAIGFQLDWFSIIDYKDTVFQHVNGESIEAAYANEKGFGNMLLHHLGKTSEILIFLIGAMTIVEIIDLHKGFDILKSFVNTNSKRKLLWMVGIMAFILSAIIDNLTTTIILVTMLRKIVVQRKLRIWFVSLVVIAANAGGAWSPIGDVTTTMLWIGKKVTAYGLTQYVILPSILCFVVPFWIASQMKVFKGNIRFDGKMDVLQNKLLSSKKMLFTGLGAIAFVPVFKGITGLPPYLGIMFGLGVVWLISEYIKPVAAHEYDEVVKKQFSAHHALSKIEFSSILFFLGILMSVAVLESLVVGDTGVGALRFAAEGLTQVVPDMNIVVVLLGMLSAVVDNVPLVAASMAMFTYEVDHPLWHFIAFSAGTGGSMLIIGSASGVAAMGMERIDFIWYLKRITLLAFSGFIAGCVLFISVEYLMA